MKNPPLERVDGAAFETGSFRDREGRVFHHRGGIYRALSKRALAAWDALLQSHFFPRLLEEGKVVGSRRVEFDRQELAALSPHFQAVLKHERIPFISYPYEWPWSMLRDAALLQLDLLLEALAEDFVLKDATPYNVQWHGVRPVFIDVVSFERWRQGDPWVAYLQFCQLYLYPLLLTARRDVAFQPLLRGSLDGISPQEIARLLSGWDRLRPGGFADVWLQSRLQEQRGPSAEAGPAESLRTDLRRAGFKKELIVGNVRRLRKLVAGLRWRRRTSQWAGYAQDNSYDRTAQAAKEDFVRRVAARRPWPLVWDLGCNTGTFSRLAAEHAETVVALDADHLAVDRLYRALQEDSHRGDSAAAKIVPLVGNLVDPSPDLGWRLGERRSLAGRGAPDLVLALALIHHVVLTGHVPLPEFVDWLADLGAELVLEWVDRKDVRVTHLLRNKEDIYHDYTLKVLNTHLERRFEVVERLPLHGGTRVLIHARPKAQNST